MKKPLPLPGDIIDINRRGIIRISPETKECPIASVGHLLRKRNDIRFSPKNWAGYPSLKSMYEAAPKHFEVYYKNSNKTDLWVRVKPRSIANNVATANVECSIEEYIQKEFTPEHCQELRDMVNFDDECFNDDCILRSCLIYRYHKATSEGKVVETAEGTKVWNTGWFVNGTVPLYMIISNQK